MKSDKKLSGKIAAQARKASAAEKKLSKAKTSSAQTKAAVEVRREQAKLSALTATAALEANDPVVALQGSKAVAQAEKTVLLQEAKSLRARAQAVKADYRRLKGKITPEQDGRLQAKVEELSFKSEQAAEGARLADKGILLRRQNSAPEVQAAPTSDIQVNVAPAPTSAAPSMVAIAPATPGTTAPRGEMMPSARLDSGPSMRVETAPFFDDTPAYMQEPPASALPDIGPGDRVMQQPQQSQYVQTPAPGMQVAMTPKEQVPEAPVSVFHEPPSVSDIGPSGPTGPTSSAAPESIGAQVWNPTASRAALPSWKPENTPVPPGSPALAPASPVDLFISSDTGDVQSAFVQTETSLPKGKNARKYLPWLGAALFGAWAWHATKGG